MKKTDILNSQWVAKINAICGDEILKESYTCKRKPLLVINKKIIVWTDSVWIVKNYIDSNILMLPKMLVQKSGLFGLKDYIIIKSLNGYVVINNKKKLVIKILNEDEPYAIQNEYQAHIISRGNLPRLYETYRKENINIIKQKLIRKKPITTWRFWSRTYKEILPKIINKRNKLIVIRTNKYKEKIKRELELVLTENQNFMKYRNNILKLAGNLFEEYMHDDDIQYKIFAHGDLTPKNVIKNWGRYYLIDFTNGGVQNYCYDLMIQSVYDVKSDTWNDFKEIELKNNEDDKIFSKCCKIHIDQVQKIYDIKLTDEQIKAGIVLSLLEILVKNIKRHKKAETISDGIEMVEHLIKIMQKIDVS